MTNKIEITKTAKYTTFGNPNTAKTILFVLHGYGQLADYFIRKFNVLDGNNYFVVAPEGLHRFYLKGSSGRVGASWMTKEERQSDIDDYIKYLDQLWLQINDKYNFDKRILLGFSQGGATASRWHCLGNFKANKFILWAAVFPPDMDKTFNSKFLESNNYLVFGKNDEYYKLNQVNNHFKYLTDNNFKFKQINFEGNHNIHSKTLLNLV